MSRDLSGACDFGLGLFHDFLGRDHHSFSQIVYRGRLPVHREPVRIRDLIQVILAIRQGKNDGVALDVPNLAAADRGCPFRDRSGSCGDGCCQPGSGLQIVHQ